MGDVPAAARVRRAGATAGRPADREAGDQGLTAPEPAGASWPRADLERRLVTTLRSFAGEAPRLAAYARHGDDAGGLLRAEDKAAAEILLLAYLASRVPGSPALAGAVRDAVDAVEPLVASPRAEALLRRFPPMAVTVGLGYVVLAALGRPHPTVDALLRRSLAAGFGTLNERSVYRMMDARWTYGLLADPPLPPPDDLFPLSTLAAAPHPIHTRTDDEYAVTHAAFYLTDFGRRPPPCRVAPDLLDPFVAWAVVTGDLDLLGEYLVAALALGLPDSAALRWGREAFYGAWDGAGLVSPGYAAERHAALAGEAAAAYLFAETYHTRAVGGILCAVALTAPPPPVASPPPATPPDAAAARCRDAVARQRAGGHAAPPALVRTAVPVLEDVVARLLGALGQDPAAPPSWLAVAGASALSRDELTGVLVAALVVATARPYHLVGLADALATAAAAGQAGTATFRAGLDHLLGQQLDDGFVGVHALLGDDTTGAAAAQEEIAACLLRVAVALDAT